MTTITDQVALWAAILTNPADDTVRLAFADELDQHGDEMEQKWADLIRLQIQATQPEEVCKKADLWIRINTLFDGLTPWFRRGSLADVPFAVERGMPSVVKLEIGQTVQRNRDGTWTDQPTELLARLFREWPLRAEVVGRRPLGGVTHSWWGGTMNDDQEDLPRVIWDMIEIKPCEGIMCDWKNAPSAAAAHAALDDVATRFARKAVGL